MMRTKGDIQLYLLRHAEAYKNLANVHGGGDQRLTPVGEQQARSLGDLLLAAAGTSDRLHVFHQPEGRSEETARNIGGVATVTAINIPDLLGVGLGVTEGLSDEELAQRFPEVAAAIEAWRANQGSLSSRPKVPGGEPMEDFAVRIERGMAAGIGAGEPGDIVAIVGTTSTLNMINHLLLHDGTFDRESYEFIQFPLGSYAVWQLSPDAPEQLAPITVPSGT